MREKANISPIKISRGQIVGIGKVKIPMTEDFKYEIPVLSFLVLEEANKKKFVSSCIHLHTDGYGASDMTAADDMVENIKGFLKSNFSRLQPDDAWQNLMELSRIRTDENSVDKDTVELWDAYRDVQFMLAQQGVSTDSAKTLRKKMELLQQRIDWLENETERLKGVISLRPVSVPSPIVDYTDIRKVA